MSCKRLSFLFPTFVGITFLNYYPHIMTSLEIVQNYYAAFNAIKRWQLHQRKPGEVVFRIVPDVSFCADHEQELETNFRAIADLRCRFEYVDHIEPTPRGKSRMLVQEVQR